MIVYHVDTTCQLVPGMFLGLRCDWPESHGLSFFLRTIIRQQFPMGVSCFGAKILQKPDTLVQRNQQTLEIILEAVRQQFYADKPSRFSVVFASRTPEEARIWSRRISGDASDYPVYEIDADKGFSAEAAILDTAPMQPDTPIGFPASLYPVAHRYWQSARPLSESRFAETSSTARRGLASSPARKEELLVPLPIRVLRRVDLP